MTGTDMYIVRELGTGVIVEEGCVIEHALWHRRSGILLTADFERADWAQLEAS